MDNAILGATGLVLLFTDYALSILKDSRDLPASPINGWILHFPYNNIPKNRKKILLTSERA